MSTEQTYTAAVVCAASGITETALRTWRSRDFVKVERTGWTRYSTVDLMRVCVLAELCRRGLDLAHASRISGGLELDPARLRSGDEHYLVTSLEVAESAPAFVRVSRARTTVLEFLGGLEKTTAVLLLDLADVWRRAVGRAPGIAAP